jgi:SRF-type transcription factor (DNA-binding and dimerisation domain)
MSTTAGPPPNGKKTKGRVKIKMEYIDNKLRRYTTFSKRKTGIMKKVRYLKNRS